MRVMTDETIIVSLSIGEQLAAEFDDWVAAHNAASDLDSRVTRSSAIRMAMRRLMADMPAPGEGE